MLNNKNTMELLERKIFTSEEACSLMEKMLTGEVNEFQLAALLAVFQYRKLRLPELEGFIRALKRASIPVLQGYQVTDVCGTGGDNKNSFNISTLAAILTSSLGVKVVKHGNYAASGATGSSNVLEAFGLTFTHREEILEEQLANENLCFLHAPLFHPGLKRCAPVRKGLGFRTFFNLLGPLVNPSSPAFKLIGMPNAEVARLYHFYLEHQAINYRLVYSADGYDECSLTAPFTLVERGSETRFFPEDLGCQRIHPAMIYGGDSVAASLKIFCTILQGRGTKEQNQVVAVNAALAASLSLSLPLSDLIKEGIKVLQSGELEHKMKRMVRYTIPQYTGI